MRRSILCLGLVIIATLLVASPASAGRRWCARDPIVSLNGHAVQVWVAIPDEYVHLVNGPIDVQFETPAGMTRTVTFTDSGFNNHGEVVTFVDDPSASVNPQGSFKIRVRVSVPIDEQLAKAELKTSRIATQVTVVEGGRSIDYRGWNTGSWVTVNVNNGNTAGGGR